MSTKFTNSRNYDPPLDNGILTAVEVLCDAGVETFESCEGGSGHAYPEPTVRFHGDQAEGLRALSVAIRGGLRVAALRRTWPLLDGEPTGPWWELTFHATIEPQPSNEDYPNIPSVIALEHAARRCGIPNNEYSSSRLKHFRQRGDAILANSVQPIEKSKDS